ncbi:MAG: NADPH-dependent F420 reductase, partial [Halobacteria archaeon]|nr:NADPH-dependent F420 reductase [Halobacteria archaeon]
PPEQGSAAREIRDVFPDSNPLAGAFHNVSAARLSNLDDELGIDIAVFGEDEAKQDALEITESIDGLRGLDAGGLEVAPQVEALTPLLINVGMKNKIKHPGIKFV